MFPYIRILPTLPDVTGEGNVAVFPMPRLGRLLQTFPWEVQGKKSQVPNISHKCGGSCRLTAVLQTTGTFPSQPCYIIHILSSPRFPSFTTPTSSQSNCWLLFTPSITGSSAVLFLVTCLFCVCDRIALVTPLWSVTCEATISHFITYHVWQFLTPSPC